MNSDRDPVTGLPIGRPVAQAGPAPAPERVRLDGRHVRIVPLDAAAHGADLAEGAVGPGSEALWQYMAAGPFDDRESFQATLEACAASADPLFYAILDARTGKAIGHAALMRIDRANRVIEVGNILYTPALQRTPGATEAMRLMAGYVFGLGYRRYEWKCNALNAPSRRAAERLGFSYEGLFRQGMIVKGRNRDTAWFSMLDGEWPQIRQGFDRWLDPANLDGGQSFRLGALNRATISGSGLHRATTADESALAALQEAAYAPNRPLLGVEPVPLLTPAAEVLGRYEVWLAETDGAPVGALVLDPAPDHLTIWSVAVDPAHQGSGLGNTLLAAAEARARDLDLSELRLYTGDKLVRNIDWYARRGYATARVEDLPDRRLVHMHKRLA
ncbi:GNAT family N-acetyltransferase [Methylobacterium platani]|uniref:GCN5 family acetyltransferase n=2 Tax=Methylobacterium platani TaxID=427683 RepID=A0A179S2H1_9HYPH|nr:GNAT family N-acetyltransferase [Methylobacterium platani]KMO17240.1 GCN5 family acetyltransferase [Methylobacterium platani JCM 14648]OAS19980.1 GCN5 family acetyltransferase [Methylobacterium platani]